MILSNKSWDLLSVFSGLSENTEFVEKTFENFDNARDKLAIYDQTIYLESLLIRQDKISMAHGLESRVPFVNVPLIEFVNSLSTKQRYNKKITKKILKKISENFFPKEFI